MFELKKGNKAAFNELFNRYEGALYRYLLRRSGNRDNTEELFQDVWEKLYKTRHEFRPQGKFRSYFFRIAHNHVIDYYRRQNNRETHGVPVEDIAQDHENEPSHLAETGESHQALLQEISRLPQEQREVLLLKEESGLSLQEIANVIGIDYETAKSRLRYAVHKLKKFLSEDEH